MDILSSTKKLLLGCYIYPSSPSNTRFLSIRSRFHLCANTISKSCPHHKMARRIIDLHTRNVIELIAHIVYPLAHDLTFTANDILCTMRFSTHAVHRNTPQDTRCRLRDIRAISPPLINADNNYIPTQTTKRQLRLDTCERVCTIIGVASHCELLVQVSSWSFLYAVRPLWMGPCRRFSVGQDLSILITERRRRVSRESCISCSFVSLNFLCQSISVCLLRRGFQHILKNLVSPLL
jgi:hypothetical protein